MSRPPLEVADLVRAAGEAFIERSRRWIRWKHVKVLRAIARCRTAALGGHIDECTRCGHRAAISYNSCRDRHCPKCQIAARDRWIAARQRELLPTRYLHVVFTLPHRLAPLVLQNKKVLYSLLFRTSAETLLEVARDPKHLGAEIGFFSVLHTWSQKLKIHPHVHCVVPAGGLSPGHTRWVRSRDNYFLPKEVLREVFRGKFVDALEQAFQNGQLRFEGDLKLLAQPKIFAAWLRPLFRQPWVVYLKRPFGGPEYVLQYLGRYTHRVAISNHRLVSFIDGQVTFRWRDSADHNRQKLLSLSVDEFLSRFLLHILPKGFVRIRNFGFLANRKRAALLPLCFQLLGSAQAPQAEQHPSSNEDCPDLWRCPKCGAPMKVMPTSEITVYSSLSGWFKDVARAVSRINLQTSGWLLRYAINTAGNLREMPVPLGVQFGRELSILFGKPISLTPFFVGLVPQPVRLTRMAQFKESQNWNSNCRHRDNQVFPPRARGEHLHDVGEQKYDGEKPSDHKDTDDYPTSRRVVVNPQDWRFSITHGVRVSSAESLRRGAENARTYTKII